MRSFEKRIREDYGSLEKYYEIHPDRKIELCLDDVNNKKNDYQKFNKSKKGDSMIHKIYHNKVAIKK